MSKKNIRRTGAGGALAAIPLDVLHAELMRRRRTAGPLLRKREKLAAQLAQLDQTISSLGIDLSAQTRRGPGRPPGRRGPGAPRGKRGPRPRNETSLIDALHKALSGKTLGVAEAVDAVLKSGYKTTSKNFRIVVNQTLLANKDRFRNVARGKYTAK